MTLIDVLVSDDGKIFVFILNEKYLNKIQNKNEGKQQNKSFFEIFVRVCQKEIKINNFPAPRTTGLRRKYRKKSMLIPCFPDFCCDIYLFFDFETRITEVIRQNIKRVLGILFKH